MKINEIGLNIQKVIFSSTSKVNQSNYILISLLESYATLEKSDEAISTLFTFPVIRADIPRRELVAQTGCKPCFKKACEEIHDFCVGFRYKRTGVLNADTLSKVNHFILFLFSKTSSFPKPNHSQ